MARILHPIFALLACATRQELARQVAYLKEENPDPVARLPERLVASRHVHETAARSLDRLVSCNRRNRLSRRNVTI